MLGGAKHIDQKYMLAAKMLFQLVANTITQSSNHMTTTQNIWVSRYGENS